MSQNNITSQKQTNKQTKENTSKKEKRIKVRTSGCRRAVYRIILGRVTTLKAIRRLESMVTAGEIMEVGDEEDEEDEDAENAGADTEEEEEEDEAAAKGGEFKEPILLKISIPKGPTLKGKLHS